MTLRRLLKYYRCFLQSCICFKIDFIAHVNINKTKVHPHRALVTLAVLAILFNPLDLLPPTL